MIAMMRMAESNSGVEEAEVAGVKTVVQYITGCKRGRTSDTCTRDMCVDCI